MKQSFFPLNSQGEDERLEKTRDQQIRSEPKTRLVEQINVCLSSGEYSRALDLLRGTAAQFPNDTELSELEKVAHDGVKRNAEAFRLITESQELFAQRKSVDAIQLLRKAYELDKNNSLARAILANALVEQAHSLVESDWWGASMLAKQALELNPAHPTAKTIRSLIRDRKETSSVEEWVSQVHKLQSSGDLLAALSLIAEGLDVHSRDPKLLLLQDAIQRDQDAQRRQSRRGDLEELRRMESEVEKATDVASKKALAERVQALAAKYWTDGAVLTVANHLLQRLGLVSEGSSSASPQSQRAPVIFHVPRPSAPETPRAAASSVLPSPVLSQAPPNAVPAGSVPTAIMLPTEVPPRRVPLRIAPRSKVRTIPPKPQLSSREVATIAAAEPSTPEIKVTSTSSRPKQPPWSNSTTVILASAGSAIILVAAIFFFAFFARTHHASPVAEARTVAAPAVSAPDVSAAGETTLTASPPVSRLSSDTNTGKTTLDDQPSAESDQNLGTLLIVAGQDNARVSINGKIQAQLTQAGHLRLPNLEPRDYVVEVSKSGFQDPPRQKIRIRRGEQASLVFNLQPNLKPQSRQASLTIQGGAPGTTVLVDQTPVGTIQPDGTLFVSTVNPGDHTVELRKEGFKPRQYKKHFLADGPISLAAADAALEAIVGELKINFAPADAIVVIAKTGVLPIMVRSGVPLNLAAGTYTLTARTAESFTRYSAVEVTGGQSKILDLSLAPSGMSKWDDFGAWKHEGNSFTRKGGDFVLYGVVPASGTFVFSAMPTKGHLLQWVLNYIDSKNYVLAQLDDKNFYRTVIRNGGRTDEIIVPHKGEKKSLRTLQVRVSPTEVVQQIKNGNSWTVLDRWTQPGTNLSLGKFGFYIPGNDQVALSGFAHYADLNIR